MLMECIGEALLGLSLLYIIFLLGVAFGYQAGKESKMNESGAVE